MEKIIVIGLLKFLVTEILNMLLKTSNANTK
jgi:hypothetical protein